tara:strand:- start:495 stop:806 length:312 start_codon:yes stop_codon:yes gene_type:complete
MYLNLNLRLNLNHLGPSDLRPSIDLVLSTKNDVLSTIDKERQPSSANERAIRDSEIAMNASERVMLMRSTVNERQSNRRLESSAGESEMNARERVRVMITSKK